MPRSARMRASLYKPVWTLVYSTERMDMEFDMVDATKSLNADRPTHQSLGRGLQILEVVSTFRGGATLAEVAQRTRLARSTTHYLMQALVNLGYLSQQSDGRSYRLGVKVFRLAGRSLSSEQIAATAMPILNELCGLTHESVAIG